MQNPHFGRQNKPGAARYFSSIVKGNANIFGPLDHSTQMTQIIKIYADRLGIRAMPHLGWRAFTTFRSNQEALINKQSMSLS